MTAPLYALTDTWNNSGTTFTAIGMTVNDTGSAIYSAFFSATSNANGNPTVALRKDGAGNPSLFLSKWGASSTDIFCNDNSWLTFCVGTAAINPNVSLHMGANFALGFSSNSNAGTSPADTTIFRDAAGVIAQRNGTNAQALRVYNTFTDASNYERASIGWASNVLTIGTEKAGTGSDRDIQINASGSFGLVSFGSAGSPQLSVSPNGAQWSAAIRPITWNGNPGDIGICRVAAKVLQITDGAAGATNSNGWVQDAGQARITSDVTVSASTTLVTATGLSVNVQAGRTYSFEAQILYTDTAAGGVKAAIAGTCTATNIIYNGWIVDSAANGIKGNAQATALGGTVASAVTVGTAGHITISGTITVNAAGTLLVQFAQNTASGSSVAKRGSYFIVRDMP